MLTRQTGWLTKLATSRDEAGDTVRALSFEEPLSAQDPTPDKTTIPLLQAR